MHYNSLDKFVSPHCVYTCVLFRENSECSLISSSVCYCVSKALINHYKIYNDVLTNYAYSTKYNGTYRRDGDVCLYIDTQTSCCCMTLPRQRVWWRRNSGRMVRSLSLVFVWWGHRTGTDRPCPTSVLCRGI